MTLSNCLLEYPTGIWWIKTCHRIETPGIDSWLSYRHPANAPPCGNLQVRWLWAPYHQRAAISRQPSIGTSWEWLTVVSTVLLPLGIAFQPGINTWIESRHRHLPGSTSIKESWHRVIDTPGLSPGIYTRVSATPGDSRETSWKVMFH